MTRACGWEENVTSVLSVKGTFQLTYSFIFLVLIRERLEKKLNFDNYQEKFGMLLHVEELQMQKDIRNYDMKGVVFQQEKEDRRFLVLEVSHWLGTSNGKNISSSNIERFMAVTLFEFIISC